MEILLKNEDKLILSWHPGCIYKDGEYILGEIGRRGLGVTEEDLKKPWIYSGHPSSLQFNIRFKNIDDIELCRQIKDVLYKFDDSNSDNIKFIHDNEPKLVRENLGLKDEFRNEVDKITQENKLMEGKIQNLLLQLKMLGFTPNSDESPKYKIVPDEWYNWKEYYDATKAGISICCHNKTQIYIFLETNGLLDKYVPEWYKLGNF